MTSVEIRSWQTVHEEVLRRIKSRQWKPGGVIPSEEDLAREFGCARATVNRALRHLAEAGLLDRRRKSGTRVALHPMRKATLSIPIIRLEIEARGSTYRYSLLSREVILPPPDIRAQMRAGPEERLIHVRALHMADHRAYAFEDRWISLAAAPEAEEYTFERQSPNEWLVANIPFEGGDISFSAVTAGADEAAVLGCNAGEGLFLIERSTWRGEQVITRVRLTFAPGYRVHTRI